MTSKELRKLAERATGGDWVHTEEDDYSTNPCIRDFTGNKIIPHTRADYRYIAAASPENIIPLCDLISSLELTLSNSTKAEALQVGQIMDQTARINKLEKALRDCLEFIDIPREQCFDDSQLGRAYDLLAAPTEPTPEESE